MIRRSVGFMAVALRPGDNNDLVRLLQARLNRDYPLYSSLVVDGICRPRTPPWSANSSAALGFRSTASPVPRRWGGSG
jgi:hypothetical protein